jgi:hypothetical protein
MAKRLPMVRKLKRVHAMALVSHQQRSVRKQTELIYFLVMGDIPAKANMISSMIISPATGQDVAANEDFDITVQVDNLEAGQFTNPDTTYYTAPQQLQNGRILGHTHVTVQDLQGNLNPQTPPDPSIFAFFKGINDNGNGNGALSATVVGGLPAGAYRICTLTSASNHQPVIMPVSLEVSWFGRVHVLICVLGGSTWCTR